MKDIFEGVYNAARNVGYSHEVAKSLSQKAVKTNRSILLSQVEKNLRSLVVMKGGRPVGSTSERKDGTYKKVGEGQWVKVTEGKGNSETQEKTANEKKGIANIHKYMTTELNKMGFEVETSGSGLSDSEYITIKNWEEKTGKYGVNNDGTYKIRISNHDLPPSYDRTHGYFDADITDGINQRSGSTGAAESYVSAMARIANAAGKDIPSHIKPVLDKWKKEKEQKDIYEKESQKKKEEHLSFLEDRESKKKYILENDKEAAKKLKELQDEADKWTGDKRKKKLKNVKDFIDEYKPPENKTPDKKEKLTTLNPTGGIFTGYDPKKIMDMELGENITTLAETAGYDPDEKITVYRGVSTGKGSIGPGDFITTNKQLAQDYAGTGTVVSETVRAGDILDDSDEPLGEEYIYYPKNK